MKAIKLIKTYRGGSITKVLFVSKDIEAEDLEEYVKAWCEGEPSGSNYGWSVKWEELTDKVEISEAIDKEIQKVQDSIESLEYRKFKLKEYKITL